MTEIRIDGIGDLRRAAAEFLQKKGDGNIIAFYGKMGAGKTTFITALCQELGVEDTVNSPTFTIVNEYQDGRGEPVYHFDFYRIESLREATDIGLDEYLWSGCLCLMEWPEKIEPLLPEETLRLEIEVIDENTRILKF